MLKVVSKAQSTQFALKERNIHQTRNKIQVSQQSKTNGKLKHEETL